MKAIILHIEDQSYMAKAESNHWLPMDSGGKGAASSPVELLLMASGGCVAMDIVHILNKSRTDFSKFRMEMDGVRAESHPKRFTEVHYFAIFDSNSLTPDVLRRALELSLTKYCSVTLSLDRSVKLIAKFSINGVESEPWEVPRNPELYG